MSLKGQEYGDDDIRAVEEMAEQRMAWLLRMKHIPEVRQQLEWLADEIRMIDNERMGRIDTLQGQRDRALDALMTERVEQSNKDAKWQELLERAVDMADEKARETIEDEMAAALNVTSFEAGDILEMLMGDGDEMTPEHIEAFKAWVVQVAKHNQAKRKNWRVG